jgi:hypothetical protein
MNYGNEEFQISARLALGCNQYASTTKYWASVPCKPRFFALQNGPKHPNNVTKLALQIDPVGEISQEQAIRSIIGHGPFVMCGNGHSTLMESRRVFLASRNS